MKFANQRSARTMPIFNLRRTSIVLCALTLLTVSLTSEPFFLIDASDSALDLWNNLRSGLLLTYSLISLLLVIGTKKATDALFNSSLPVKFVLVWFAASISWSISPYVSFRELFYLMAPFVAFASSMVSFKGERDFLKAFMLFGLVFVFVSFAAVICFPALAIHHGDAHEGYWKGVVGHKNAAGRTFAVIALIALGALRANVWRYRSATVLVLAILFLLMTGSKTSLALVMISPMLAALISLKRSSLSLILAQTGLFAGFVVATLYLLVQLGDIDFTGRVGIWKFAYSALEGHIFQGFGYGAFWHHEDVYLPVKDRPEVFYVPHSHNGYLEVAMYGGVVAVLAVGICLVAALIDIVDNKKNHPEFAFFCFTVFIFSLVYNITESALFYGDSVVWLLLLGVLLFSRQLVRRDVVRRPRRYARSSTALE